jgi:type IV secretory pathway VirB2 component (pilin)
MRAYPWLLPKEGRSTEEKLMTGWALLVIGLVAAGIGLFVGVVSWEVTMGLVLIGLGVAALGAYTLIRGRRTA